MEQLGAGSRTKRIEALPKSALKLVGSHSRRPRRRTIVQARCPIDERVESQTSAEQADTHTVAKKRRGEDPVARLQELARWSSYTNSWLHLRAPGRPPRWVRRTLIAAIVVMAVVGLVVGFIGLLTHDRSMEGLTGCPTGAVGCLNLYTRPTGP